jgi:hypothetical protein
MSFPKTCSCCRRTYGWTDWITLPFKGYQDDGDGGRLELRNCICGSTIAIEVTPEGLTEILRGELAEVCRNDAREVAGYPPPYTWPPKPRRKVSAEEEAEAERLHDIADALMGVDTRSKAKGRAA